MLQKTYIIIVMILILIILTYHANVFGKKKELIDSSNDIIKPKYDNIDNLDIKQLKNIVNEQNELISKQKEIIENHIEKINKNNKKYTENIIKPNENIDDYFKKLREITDNNIKNNISEEDMIEKNQKLLKVVKRYLEDPLMRGYNIYESEQYSKLLEIGNIQIRDKVTPPHPQKWSININK
jgi:predicted PurR-regulated permease PerM